MTQMGRMPTTPSSRYTIRISCLYSRHIIMPILKILSVTKRSSNIANVRFSYVPLTVILFRMRKEKMEEPVQVEILLETITKTRLRRNLLI